MELSHKYNVKADIHPLILAINTMGINLIGLELGVYRAESFMTILHNCNNVKKLIGVDSWQPYTDYIKEVPDGKPCYSVGEKESEFNKSLAYLQLKYGNVEKRYEILEKDSLEAAKDIPDESLDFIFFDAMMTAEQTYAEAMIYYKKIKKGGYFTGHDSIAVNQVLKPIEKVKQNYNNKNELVVYSNCFLFKI